MRGCLSLVLYLLLGLGCKPTEFKATGGAQAKPTPTPEDLPKEPEEVSTKTPPKDSLATSDDGCLTEVLPVNFMIVIDTSTSMAPAINAIKFGLVRAISRLEKIVPQGASESIPEVRVGAVSFVDNRDQTTFVTPTANLNQVRAQIGQLAIDPLAANLDGPEAGILGLQRAFELLQDEASAGNVNVVLYISDNFAHGGGTETARNYNHAAVAAAAASLPNFYFYDSTPDVVPQSYPSDGPPPSNARTPAEQMRQVRDEIKQAAKLDKSFGTSLGFPFTEATFLNTLPSDLSQSLKLCNE